MGDPGGHVLGSVLIGVLFGLLVGRAAVDSLWRLAILVGVLRGFTTFSTFSFETFGLIQDGLYLRACWNIIFSVVLCILGTALGVVLTR